jgi:hypothetical protein
MAPINIDAPSTHEIEFSLARIIVRKSCLMASYDLMGFQY